MINLMIQNKRIMDFCEKHPNFDIERTVLSFIDFIEDTYSNTVPSLDSNLASHILANLKSLQTQVHGLNTNINNVKKEYLGDIKNILMVNNTEKIIPIIKEYNESFINKLSLLIPKEQLSQTQQLQSIFKSIEQSIIIEMNKDSITQTSIDQMLCNIEQKFANILTHSEQKITNVLSAVSENKNNDLKLHTKLDEMLDKLGKNTEKGKISENLLNLNLQAVYPTAEIRNMSSVPHSGDFWIIRKDKPSVLIENKNFDGTVYTEDVQKFIDNMNTQNMCGIMISQLSNIVHRKNYEIEIHNGNIAVYIHECKYDPYKIKIAVQIIDAFKLKIEKQNMDSGNIFTINKEILIKINNEFQLFNNRKNQHLIEIKNMYDTLTKSAEDMDFETLDSLLETLGLLTNVKKYICSNCPRPFKTQKGLDTHERICCDKINCQKKGIKCEMCDEIIPTIKGMKTHCLKKHIGQLEIE